MKEIHVHVLHVKKNSAKNYKIAFFGSHIVCIGLVFTESNGVNLKISSNHLKLCAEFFCGICQVEKLFNLKIQRVP